MLRSFGISRLSTQEPFGLCVHRLLSACFRIGCVVPGTACSILCTLDTFVWANAHTFYAVFHAVLELGTHGRSSQEKSSLRYLVQVRPGLSGMPSATVHYR